jgi:hypothetical protein
VYRLGFGGKAKQEAVGEVQTLADARSRCETAAHIAFIVNGSSDTVHRLTGIWRNLPDQKDLLALSDKLPNQAAQRSLQNAPGCFHAIWLPIDMVDEPYGIFTRRLGSGFLCIEVPTHGNDDQFQMLIFGQKLGELVCEEGTFCQLPGSLDGPHAVKRSAAET